MFRNLLVANDLSDASRPALRTALELARRFEATCTVLHVTVPHYPANHWYVPHIGEDAAMLDAISGREQETARELLAAEVRQALGTDADTVPVTVLVKVGSPADEILATAATIAADLIVVGTHGRHGVERLLLGSTAESVARKARRSVLTVYSGKPPERGKGP